MDFRHIKYPFIKEAWNVDKKGGMRGHRLNRSLFDTSIALQKWNTEVFGYAHSNQGVRNRTGNSSGYR